MKAMNVLMCAGLALCCSGAAMADKPELQIATPKAKVLPIAMQRAILNPDGSITLVGKLIPYEGGSARTNYGIAFDCFEPDSTGFMTDGAAVEGYDPKCFAAGDETLRWFFGPDYVNAYTANDMVTNPANDGDASERVQFAWYMQADEINLQVGVWTAQSFSDDCSGFDSDGDGVPDLGVADLFDGVIYTFGFIGVGGYYYTDIDLVGSGLFHQMPTGPGGYLIGYYGDDDFDGEPDRFSFAQSMLWGTEKIGNDSHQDIWQWDDDAPDFGDGIHTAPDECYPYDEGLCPDPLGTMIAFYGGGDGGCIADCDGNGEVNTLDFLCFLNLFSAGDPGADCDGNGSINTLDFLCFLNAYSSGC